MFLSAFVLSELHWQQRIQKADFLGHQGSYFLGYF
jgi:hypothetical protein